MRKMICVLLAFCLLAGVGLAEVAPESQSLGLSGVGNARELGGYACADGRVVKHGVFLRTAALANATEEDIRILQDDYHLSTIVDLRMTAEAESAPDPEIEGVKYLRLGIIDEEEMAAKRQAISAEVMEGLDLSKKTDQLKLAIRLGIISDQMYVEFLSGEPGKAGYARLFRELLALPEGGSLLFHCTQGKDRTGCAAMLILSALGVDEETILADFMLTNAFNAALIESERQMLIASGLEGDELETYMRAMDEVDPQYMINALDWMKANYGSVLNYIRTELGVTDGEIELLREKYLAEADLANAA